MTALLNTRITSPMYFPLITPSYNGKFTATFAKLFTGFIYDTEALNLPNRLIL